jgi:hypothetical protein
MQLDPLQTPPRSINLATPDFLVMNGTVRGGRSILKSSSHEKAPSMELFTFWYSEA